MPDSILTGICTNAIANATSVSSATDFIAGRVQLQCEIQNITDGSTGRVSAILTNGKIITTPMTGGSDNLWQSGDHFKIYINKASVLQFFPFSYSVSGDVKLAAKIMDIRWHARARWNEIQRTGVLAQHFEFCSDPYRDPNHGYSDETKEPFRLEGTHIGLRRDLQKIVPTVIGAGGYYREPVLRKIIVTQISESYDLTKEGGIVRGGALIAAPLDFLYRRGDVFHVNGRFWIIAEPPYLEYLRNREAIGVRMQCAAIYPSSVNW